MGTKINPNKAGWAVLTALISVSILLITCSEKIVNNRPGANGTIRIDTKLAPSTIASLSLQLFRLTVTGPGMEPVIVYLHPVGDAGTLVADTTIPYGISRTFTLEADYVRCLQSAFICDTIPLFKGETVSDVNPGVPLDLGILLTPVVPMIRISPKFTKVNTNIPFVVDVTMYNIDSLATISCSIQVQDKFGGYYNYFSFDVIVQAPGTDPAVTFSTEGNWFGYWQQPYQYPILEKGNTGKLARATLMLTPDTGTVAIDTVGLSLSVYSMYKLNGDSVAATSVYYDNAILELHRLLVK